jgi:enamine deaminase RidA (YjgF/YER057c/UK114 family)
MSKIQRPLFEPVVRIPANHDQFRFSGIVGITGVKNMGRWVTSEGITRQAELAFDVFTQRLGEVSLSLSHVRETGLFIVDIDDNYDAVNGVYVQRFGEALRDHQLMPARSAVGVAALADVATHPLLFEMNALASAHSLD